MTESAAPKLPVSPKMTYFNPEPAELKAWALEMPNAKQTDFGAPNVTTRVLARSKGSTYIATDDPSKHSDQCMSKADFAAWSKKQNDYIADKEMVVIDGYIGNDAAFRTPTRLIIEKANANIAGMQQQLYYPFDFDGQGAGYGNQVKLTEFENESARGTYAESFKPELTVIYTPNLKAEGCPDDRLIAVDLEAGVTRVFNSDYFGESKKGGLRMWNKLVYDRGGLSLHAGSKIIPVGDQNKVALIIGLSGTGKTTTTFTSQNESKPVQDDFVALMPGGKVYSTENGCFAKTYGLDPDFEPAIYNAVNQPEAYLENVSANDAGKVDYFDESYTKNGRATFTMNKVAGAGDAREIEHADVMLILNRNEDIIPGVAKLDAAQAAAYFMLGETKGTAAGGAAEEGKSLRVPGTNPFFPLQHAQQANRLRELLETCPLEVYVLNTGRVGGPEGKDGSKKVKIPHSSAIVKGIAEGTIQWTEDADFGYQVASAIPGVEDKDLDILQPRKLYEAQGRMDEYNKKVATLKQERTEFLAKWKGLESTIADAVK